MREKAWGGGPLNAIVRLLTVALLVALTVLSAPGIARADSASNNRVADASTSDSYIDAVDLENNSTRNSGRMWTDKSVSTQDVSFSGDASNGESLNTMVGIGDSDFLVIYSALATSEEVTKLPRIPVDVVFVLDFSSSMTWTTDGTKPGKEDGSDSRIAAMIDALNQTIYDLQQDNPQNRIGIVYFNRIGRELLPLTSLEDVDVDDANNDGVPDYLSLATFDIDADGENAAAEVTCNIPGKNGKTSTAKTDSKTNIYYGLNVGMDMLSEAEDTTFTDDESGNTYSRIPNVVLMSDGAPTTISSPESGDLGENWWGSLDENDGDSLSYGDNNQAWSANGMMPMVLAQYKKAQITDHYKSASTSIENVEQAEASMYTIGFSVNQQSKSMAALANLLLDPEATWDADNLNADDYPNGNESASDEKGFEQIEEIIAQWKNYVNDEQATLTYIKDHDKTGITTGEFTLEHPSGDEEAYDSDTETPTYVDAYYPAEMAIPLRVNSIEINADGGVSKNETNGAYPLRVVYALSLRDGVVGSDGHVNESEVSSEYLNTYTDQTTGTVSFYANAYSGAKQGDATVGDATVTFTPSIDNPYYFIQEDTALYTDSACTQPATAFDQSGTYYFQSTYFEGTGESATKNEVIARLGNLLEGYTEEEGGRLYLEARAPRLGNLLASVVDGQIGDNATNTASSTYYPTFVANGTDGMHAQNGVGGFKVYLGNNGKITVPAPVTTGDLTVSKTVASAGSVSAPEDATFSYSLELKNENGDALTGAFAARKYAAASDGDSPDQVGSDFTMADGSSFELQDGQYIVVSGLPDGTAFTVEEEDSGQYIESVTGSEGIVADGRTASGTISARTNTQVSYTNTYQPDVTIPAASTLAVTKTLEGKDLSGTDGDANNFDFTVTPVASSDGQTTQEEAAAKLGIPDGQSAISFSTHAQAMTDTDGDGVADAASDTMYPLANGLTFTAADAGKTFTYEVAEVKPSTVPTGYTYDAVTKHVVTYAVGIEDGDVTVTAAVDGTAVSGQGVPTVAFTNKYAPTGQVTTDTTEASAQLTKVLNGRDWADSETFSFKITGDDDASREHMPEQTTVTVGKPATGNSNTFKFGPFTFDAAGTYRYTVEEVPGTAGGMTYSNQKAEVTIEVFDNKQGGYAATVSVANPVFTNTYTSGQVNYDTAGGLQIVKTLKGHDISSGLFEFTLTPTSDDARKKLGTDYKVVSTGAAQLAGSAATETIPVQTGMTFTKDDAGKSFTFEVSETKGGDENAGYTNDPRTYKVDIAVSDDGNGTLTVVTRVDGKEAATYTSASASASASAPVALQFTNSYSAESTSVGGDAAVQINATKTLDGRPMTAGEFKFLVKDDKGETVAEGTNAAAGDGEPAQVTFDKIEYSTEKLNKDVANRTATITRNADGSVTYEYAYSVVEDTGALPSGVSGNTTSGQVIVRVTDDGEGHLTAAVNQAKPIAFSNVYGTSDQEKVHLNGNKVLATSDPSLSGPSYQDIEGKFTFELTGSEGAPMPEKTTVTNDASGNVDFGEISYTMKNVFGAEASTAEPSTEATGAGASDASAAPRTKTFTYTVKESGSYSGVTNDGTTKTVTVTVTDNGDGTISVAKTADQGAASGMDFTFTNTYGVTPGTSSPTKGGMSITKAISGRKLNEGEFAFQMSCVGAPDEVDPSMSVLTASNDAEGKVVFDDVSFTKAGTYTYAISEIPGSAGGVTYDSSVYYATATVTDNKDGTLAVKWSATDASGKKVEAIAFNNAYQITQPGSIIFGASKVLDGRDLKGGEFSFELKDADGNVLQTVKNASNGSVVFADPVTYDELGGGTYEYTISEVLPEDDDPQTDGVQKDGVTYDQTVFHATVTVTDNGDGTTTAKVSYDSADGQLPVFANTCSKTEVPPETSGGGTSDGNASGAGGDMPQTSDFAPTLVGATALAGAALVAVGVVLRKKRGER